MGNDEEFFDEGFFYPSDFEDDVEDLVGVEEFLFGLHGDGKASSSFPIYQGTWEDGPEGEREGLEGERERHESEREGHEGEREGHEGEREGHDGEREGHEGTWEDGHDDEREVDEGWRMEWHYSESEGDEEKWEELEDSGGGRGNSSHDNFMDDIQEPSLPQFEHVLINTFPKYVHFTHSSIKLMVECLQGSFFPTYSQIHEADAEFIPLLTDHGRPTTAKIQFHTIDRWKELQGKLKVVQSCDGMAISPVNDAQNRVIPPLELWHSIVQKAHIHTSGKHLLVTPTKIAIRSQWSTDVWVGGIPKSFIENCLQSCQLCQGLKWWNEIVTIPQEDLNATLDALCVKHIVRIKISRRVNYKQHSVRYYCCHRGGNKDRAHRKKNDGHTLVDKNSRRDRMSRLCNCTFEMKVVEHRIVDESKEGLKGKREATIHVHTGHTGHQPGSDIDSFFLPVHPYVLTWAEKNLKFMYSTGAVASVSERDQELFRQSVGELERITYRFHIIKTEVQALAYHMRASGKRSHMFCL